ncbi:MAG: hypothetical protein WC702_01875 [Patescibacteria group bacterium]|jgi:hypothetical protein
MDDPKSIPEERVAAAVKITAEFEDAMAAIKAEYKDLLKKSIKENDERFIVRLRENIASLYEKLTGNL